MVHIQELDERGRRSGSVLAPPLTSTPLGYRAPGRPGAGPEHAVIITDPTGAITDWNPGAEKLFGFPRHQALGLALDFLVPVDCRAEQVDIMQAVARGEPIARPETVRLGRGGQRVDVSLTVAPLHDSAGAPCGAVTIAHDLAAHKHLELQLRQAQKMEVFGHLAGGVAHDFNNLLTVILGYSELLLTQVPARDAKHELLTEIHKAGERAESLTRQLLAFGRKQMTDIKVLDLNAIVADTEKMLRRLIGEDIEMTTTLAPTLPPVKVDPGQMQQVIMNLAVNARDAMPGGGRLTIETDLVRFDDAYGRAHPQVQPGDYVRLSIRDTGVGMSTDTKARLFEPLFTTKGPGKGTGLGLATVNGIVRQSCGHIEVHSELDVGSTFRVYLPSAAGAEPASNARHGLRARPAGHETILLVEDADSVRLLVRHVLESCGYTVLEATNGAEALRLVESQAAPIHLLVSDVVMPHLGGRALADRLLQSHPHLKVLFLSGYTNDAVISPGVNEPKYAFLQKPFTTAALTQKVREVLDAPP